MGLGLGFTRLYGAMQTRNAMEIGIAMANVLTHHVHASNIVK
jgi:hypothetical protein